MYAKFTTAQSFRDPPPENPQTFRDQVLREIWDTKIYPKDDPKKYVTTNMID